MKILMVMHIPNVRTAGPARHMHFLRDEMTKLGHYVDLMFTDDVPDPFRGSALAHLSFPALACYKILRLLRIRAPYDLITMHTLAGFPYVALRRIVKTLPPCVIVSHGSDELRWELEKEEDHLGYRKLGWRSKLLYYNLVVRQGRFATRHADHVITGSRSEREYYIDHYGMHPDKIAVIPNGVPDTFFQKRKYSTKPSRLLYLGGWEWRKGTKYLIEAFSRVAEAHDHVTLTIAGTGAANGILEQFPQHARSKITVIPGIEAPALPNIYSTHDIFVLPTLFESIPLVIPEAMASGMPIVTSDTCGIPDIIEDGRTGYLVKSRDAYGLSERIIKLLNDPSLCEQMGREAQEKAKEITWACIARQTIQVYEEVLSHHPHDLNAPPR